MGSLPRKVAGESMNYEDYDTLAVYQLLLKNLFLSITSARFYILPKFFLEMIPLMTNLNFIE